MNPSPSAFRCPHPKLAVAAGCLLVLGVALTAIRVVKQYQTPGPFDPSAQGMCDFHNGIYFPTRALLDGLSPYSQTYSDQNPVARQIPFFSPVILVLHVPLVILPLALAEWIYFVFSVAMVLAMAWLAASAAQRRGRVDWILFIAAGIVFSRSGHVTLFDGYFTIELVLASWLAVHWAKKRPRWSALALLIVSAKPTYILPIGFLMLARGDYKALLMGAVLSIVGAALPLTWLASHYAETADGSMDWRTGFETLLLDIQTTQEVHMSMDDELPANSWTRIDLLAVVSKWLHADPSQLTHVGFMGIALVPPMVLLWRRQRLGQDDGIAGLTGGLIFSSAIVSVYHQSYDALLIVAPLVGILGTRLVGWRKSGRMIPIVIAALMLGALYNYLSTNTFLNRFDLPLGVVKMFTSLSGAGLAAAHLLICWVVMHDRNHAAQPPDDSHVPDSQVPVTKQLSGATQPSGDPVSA